VTFPASLAVIPEKAFNGCIGLKTVSAEGAGVIGTNAFFGCAALETVKLAAELESVADSAFANCTSMKTTPDLNGVKGFGKGVFQGCTALVGGKGTAYDANHVDYEYARIDGGEEQPGYFTYKPSRDLNDDGKVSTADIQVIINEMKGAQQSGTVSPEKDLNNDGKISTADIQVIINEMKK
jgi:hypothetical protein